VVGQDTRGDNKFAFMLPTLIPVPAGRTLEKSVLRVAGVGWGLTVAFIAGTLWDTFSVSIIIN
jgi:hypothetical protein